MWISTTFSSSFRHPLPPTPVCIILTVGGYLTYQQSGEPPILPLCPPVPLYTCQSRPYLLPNTDEPHNESNIVSKDLPDRAPINNNRLIPSKYTHECSLIVEFSMVATHGTNTYNTQLLLLGTASIYILHQDTD